MRLKSYERGRLATGSPRVGDVWRWQDGRYATVVERPEDKPLVVVVQFDDGERRGMFWRTFWKSVAQQRPEAVQDANG